MEAVCIAPCLVGRGGRIMLEAIIKAHILAAAIAVAPNMLIMCAGSEVKNEQNEQGTFHVTKFNGITELSKIYF